VSWIDRALALLGVIPPFLMLWWVERFERRVLEPAPDWRYRVLAAGGFVTIPVLIVERLLSKVMAAAVEPVHTLFDAFVIAGAVEESGKAACIVLLTRGLLGPRTRYGAFLYALHASMGFAVVENVVALLRTPDLEALTQRFVLRAYLAVPMHLATGGLLGFLWARRRFDRDALGLPAGLSLAVLLHGGFDALLFAVDRLPESEDLARSVCAAVAFVLPLIGLLVLAYFAHRLRALDALDDKERPRGRRSSVRVDAPPTHEDEEPAA
jgi:RsiW-degrading membrane proteinase PrsW (M82 family)